MPEADAEEFPDDPQPVEPQEEEYDAWWENWDGSTGTQSAPQSNWSWREGDGWDEVWNGESNEDRHQRDGWLSDAELRRFNVARIDQTTAMNNGRWSGSYDSGGSNWSQSWDASAAGGKPSEKLVVPEFDGEAGNEQDLGRSARSYVRKVQVWLRCTKMPSEQRALALYSALTGKAWIYAEELDVDILASDAGVAYFLEWVQTTLSIGY